MKTIITLTTIPSRLSFDHDQGIKSCIDSLVNQSYENYEIYFNIPNENKTTKEEYIIPDWLLEYGSEKIKIFRTEDLGPATKLIPTVERLTDPEDIIIVADDDLIYHPDMVQAHIDNQIKWKEEVIGYDGLRSRNEDGTFALRFKDSRDYYFTSSHFSSRVDILQHYKTVSYKRRYFEDDFFDFVNENFSWSDDLLLAGYFSFKKRDRIVETHPLIPHLETYEDFLNGGGVKTFPVINHTIHENFEGCNIFRQTHVDDNGSKLYKFIDTGYIK
jgi:glycosyltransferase involved in cell wall biosynthesis